MLNFWVGFLVGQAFVILIALFFFLWDKVLSKLTPWHLADRIDGLKWDMKYLQGRMNIWEEKAAKQKKN